MSPQQALSQAILCQTEEHAIACLDSAIRFGILREDEVPALLARSPARLRPLARELTPTADSGWESIVITRIRRGGLRVRSQAEVPGVGRLDGLIEECVGLEVNGLEFHTGSAAVVRDTSRVLETWRRGMPTITVTPHHVRDAWPATWAAIVRTVTDELRHRGR